MFGWLKNAPPSTVLARNDDVLLTLLGAGDTWRVEDSFQGTQIFGTIGSGKTSGSGQTIAEKFLRAGYGGLVLTAVTDELKTWKNYLERTNRLDDLVVLQPGGEWSFGFLDYERRQMHEGGGLTENLVALFSTVLEVAEKSASGGDSEGSFWRRAMQQLLRNTIGLINLTTQPLNIRTINDLISSASNWDKTIPQDQWEYGFCSHCLEEAVVSSKGDRIKENEYAKVSKYWLESFPSLKSETRGSICITFTSFADCMMSYPVCDIFSPERESDEDNPPPGHTKCLKPELSHKGKVIVVNLPARSYHQVGQFAQVLYKYVWQRAAERGRDKSRPIFLWVDESHLFLNSHDRDFQTTARHTRTATVYLTQSISNYYTIMREAEVNSLLGNLNTKIFHSNTDSVTNEWAAKLIGQEWTVKRSGSSSISSGNAGNGPKKFLRPGGGKSNFQHSSSWSEELHFHVRPEEFSRLKTGGKDNGYQVEGYFVQGGRQWSDGQNYALVVFRQKPKAS